MPILKTKKGRPFGLLRHREVRLYILTKVGKDAVDKVAQDISESDLIPETRKWLEKKRAEVEAEE